MGTNYYLYSDVCQHCGRGDDPLHIGKSSAGWCFALHVTEEIKSLDDWVSAWLKPKAVIRNEYGDVVPPEDMLGIITKRQWPERPNKPPYGYISQDQFHEQNHSVPGPNNLVRSKIDGHHCIGHGDGTWDLMPGEFS